MDETVQEIIKHREDAGNLIFKRIQDRGTKKINDISIACFCYILEKTGFKKAIPELGILLAETREIRKRGEFTFTKYFAIHATKVLAKHPGSRADLAYPDDDITRTIRRIRRKGRKR